MNASFFSKKEPTLRAMKRSDISRVVSIIEEHDEDDAEEANESLQNSLEGMFVLDEGGMFSLEESGGVIGVIGARSEPDVDDVVWLSWTYVTTQKRGQGYGKTMMQQLIDMLRQNNIRKMFIATSNYQEDGKEIYQEAKALYKSMGAQFELEVPAYHDYKEAQQIYGLSLQEGTNSTSDIEPLNGTLEFYDVNPVSESDRGFALYWRIHDNAADLPHPLEQLNRYVKEGQEHNARILIATLPTDISEPVASDFHEVGFRHLGCLTDYHCPGLNQEYWLKTF